MSTREADKHYMIGTLGALLRHAETIIKTPSCEAPTCAPMHGSECKCCRLACNVAKACMRCAYLQVLDDVTMALQEEPEYGLRTIEQSLGALREYSDAVIARERKQRLTGKRA